MNTCILIIYSYAIYVEYKLSLIDNLILLLLYVFQIDLIN